MTKVLSSLALAVRVGTVATLSFAALSAFATTLHVPESIKQRGFLVVGIEPTYPPMAYKDPNTNQQIGFNIDLAKAMGKASGVEVRFEEMSFEQLQASLVTGRIDVIGTAMSDLPSRREKLTFIDYMTTGAQMFTTTGNAADDPTAFCGKNIGAPRTTSYYGEVQAWSDEYCTAKGKPAAIVKGISGATATRVDLKQARLDAAVLGPEYVSYIMNAEPNTFVPVGKPITEQYFGLAVNKQDTEIRDLLAAALTQVLQSDVYLQTLTKYGLEKQAVSRVTINGGE
jgi:polar amino acid transport system substrate-binding protein